MSELEGTELFDEMRGGIRYIGRRDITPPRGEPMKSEWISIDDDMPESGSVLHVLTADGRVIAAQLDLDEWEGVRCGELVEVVAWQPAPEPPCAAT